MFYIANMKTSLYHPPTPKRYRVWREDSAVKSRLLVFQRTRVQFLAPILGSTQKPVISIPADMPLLAYLSNHTHLAYTGTSRQTDTQLKIKRLKIKGVYGGYGSLATLTEDLSSVPSIHLVTYNHL